jgi:hypothetical protein
MLKIFIYLIVTYLALIMLAVILKNSEFSQVILGGSYYFPLIFSIFISIPGVTEGGGCSLFGDCTATPFGWLLITLFWFVVVSVLSCLLSIIVIPIKKGNNMNIENEILHYKNAASNEQVQISLKYLFESLKLFFYGILFYILPGLIPNFELLGEWTYSPWLYWPANIIAVVFIIRAISRISFFQRLNEEH